MTTDLTTTSHNRGPVTAPTTAARELLDLLAVYRNKIETMPAGLSSISDANLPTPAERRALEVRASQLRQSLTPAKPQYIAARIAQMFLRFPSSRVPESQWNQTAAVYVEDLATFPLWAIDRGCKALISGRTGQAAAFAPSSAEVRAAVVKELSETREELGALQAVLTANVYHEPTADEKERVQAGFSALIKDLKLNEPFEAQAKRAAMSAEDKAAMQAIAEGKPDPRPVPKLSAEAIAKLGIKQDSAPAGA